MPDREGFVVKLVAGKSYVWYRLSIRQSILSCWYLENTVKQADRWTDTQDREHHSSADAGVQSRLALYSRFTIVFHTPMWPLKKLWKCSHGYCFLVWRTEHLSMSTWVLFAPEPLYYPHLWTDECLAPHSTGIHDNCFHRFCWWHKTFYQVHAHKESTLYCNLTANKPNALKNSS